MDPPPSAEERVGKWQPDGCGTENPGADTGASVTRREDSTVTWSEVVRRGGTKHTEVDKTVSRLLSQNNPVSKNKV